MMKLAKINYQSRFWRVLLALTLFLGLQLMLMWQLRQHDEQWAKTLADNQRCNLILEEFRMCDQRLTRLARAFCATRDEKLRREYDYILDWTAGKELRPRDLNPRITRGNLAGNISQVQLLAQCEVAPQSVRTFEEAEKLSNELVAVEKQAMECVAQETLVDGPRALRKSEMPDEFAARVLYDDAYQKTGDQISAQLDAIFKLEEARAELRANQLRQQKLHLRSVLLATQLLAVIVLSLLMGNFTRRVQEEHNSINLQLSNRETQLKTMESQRQRTQRERDAAGTIQQTFLPEPPVEKKASRVFGEMIPAKTIGGDFYDFRMLDDTHLAIAIGDVSGKGFGPAIVMARSITLFRAGLAMMTSRGAYDLVELTQWMNAQLYERNETNIFLTFFVAVYNPLTQTIQYCNAGHNPPILMRRGGKLETLDAEPGVPLGLQDDALYQQHEILFHAGDALVLYTDGITDACAQDGQYYGLPRLLQTLSEQHKLQHHACDLVEAIIADVNHFAHDAPQADDLTLLVLQEPPF